VIGGGPIGIELGQIFHMLGSKVSILEAMPSILSSLDRKIASRLEGILDRQGIPVDTNAQIKSITTSPGGLRVHFSVDDEAHSTESQIVLTVVGRRPNVDGLGLEKTHVEVGSQGIKVDKDLRTTEHHIFALGDVIGQPMFAHWATAQAQALAGRLLGRAVDLPNAKHNSAVIFSYPEVGTVGLTEEEAQKAGVEVAVAEYDYATDARAQISGNAEGLLRIVYRLDDQTVIGVHALVEGAADLMGEAALAVTTGARLSDLAGSIHPHPTLSESFGLCSRSVTTSGLPQNSRWSEAGRT
ncbi:MAG TPA: NAD(P)/FAD-dependent oxidoreductase, partial [Spirochaetia bacterium]|nr:NAD(P)/FAD-dependent oxidoreductase [Spirochaetia bacterium]